MESILNVDDYGPGRYARTRVLERAGYNVHEATTGKEALELAATYSPPLILLDVNLPDMSGFEVCRRMRQDPRTLSSTIVHISASNIQAHHQVTGLNGGADSYLVEPIEPTVLIATVKALFRARRAEEALRRSNEELEQFSYRVAHDLTEPLRTIVAHTQLMQLGMRSQSVETLSGSMNFVVDASKRMQSFIDGLLEYCRVSYEASPIKEFDAEELLAAALTDLGTAIQESGAQVTHDPLPKVLASAGFEQVFQNLIGNSIKYRRENVIPEIHISAKMENDFWVFSVRDNGMGIEPRYHDYVFQAFRRLHGREIPGSGIGLATCKKMVEAHGGTLWLESQFGVGSTFYFKLPRATINQPLSHNPA